ncbi:hypothetical protein [Ohtaekwangia kribbensis]
MRFVTRKVNCDAMKKSAEIDNGRRDFPSWGMDVYVRICPWAGI